MAKMHPQRPNPHTHGDLAMRTVAMPADTNSGGEIFGGWLLSQMDLAGSVIGRRRSRCRLVTVAINGMSFIESVAVGDTISCYAKILEVGTTSMQVRVSAWKTSEFTQHSRQVTEGIFTYVAIGENGRPQKVDGRGQ